ncbi:MAG: DUF6992 family protein, partial [Cyclonatronaceae bacterium]
MKYAIRQCLKKHDRSIQLYKIPGALLIWLALLINIFPSQTHAQSSAFERVQSEKSASSLFYDELPGSSSYLEVGNARLQQERTAMLILLSWGLGSLAAGSGVALSGTEKYQDFALMNAGWGAVNAGIAAFALAGADSYTAATSFETVLKDEQFFNRILAINSGLNVAYVSVGFSMNYLGQSSRTRQFGSAVMLQGAFLMAFDAWLLWNSS